MNAQAAKNKANINAKAAEVKNLLNKQTAKNVRAKMNTQAAKNKANINAKAAELKNLLNKQTAKNVRAKMNTQAAKNKANNNAKAAEIKNLLSVETPENNINRELNEVLGRPGVNLSHEAYGNINEPNNKNKPINLSHEAYGNIKEPNMNNNEKNWSNWAKKGLNPLHNGMKSKQKPRLTKKLGSRNLLPKKRR